MDTHQPKYITYKGAKYERVGLVNEIVVVPRGRYTLLKGPDGPDGPNPGSAGDDDTLYFKGYITGATALDAWKTWFNESGEKEIEKIYDDSPENEFGDGREAKDVDDFLENSDIKYKEGNVLELDGKALDFSILHEPVGDGRTYLIFRDKLSQEAIDAILALGESGIIGNIDL